MKKFSIVIVVVIIASILVAVFAANATTTAHNPTNTNEAPAHSPIVNDFNEVVRTAGNIADAAHSAIETFDSIVSTPAHSDTDEKISLKVMRRPEGEFKSEQIGNVHDGETYRAYKHCNLYGDEFEYVFDDSIKSFSYKLTAIQSDGSVYTEDWFYTGMDARIIGDSINFLSVIGYGEDGEIVAKATFTIDTTWVERSEKIFEI